MNKNEFIEELEIIQQYLEEGKIESAKCYIKSRVKELTGKQIVF